MHFQSRNMKFDDRLLKKDCYKILGDGFYELEYPEVTIDNFSKIKKSSGELVTFVDADDFISKTYITNLVEPFYKKSDIYCMSIGNFSLVYDNNSKIKKIDCSVVENIQAKELLDRLATSKGGGYVWNKMFRRDLLKKIKFFSIQM